MNADKLVIGLVGMPGAGKSLVVETARQEGYVAMVMGDVIREETQKRNLELNPKNMGEVMLELRRTGGNSAVAEKCIPKILQQQSNKILIDGLRSLHEVDTFKAHFARFSLMAVHASPETRFNRLHQRRRSDDPKDWEVFHERDMRELSVGLGDVIAMAQHLIINETNRDRARTQVKDALHRVEKKWTK